MARYLFAAGVLIIFAGGGAYELMTGRYIGVGRVSLFVRTTPGMVRFLGAGSIVMGMAAAVFLVFGTGRH